MSLGIKVVKGMKDTLPQEVVAWEYFEKKLVPILKSYGYLELRMPLLEQTELFKRAIGEVTDIVEKEMYTFQDKGGDSLTLRPEGTAQCVRLILENNLLRGQTQRVWYQGAMFRRENPQKGRYRQFHQFGVEAYGLSGPEVDAEQILMMRRLWQVLGLDHQIHLQINSLGSAVERATYREALIQYLRQCEGLDPDSIRRLNTNPLRILDSKNPLMQEIIQQAPNLLDYLGEASLAHFKDLQGLLDTLGVPYQVNPRLVRGIDYYTHTVYEWVTTALGAQGTVCAGGRYNDLVAQMGGPDTPAVGFALGVERIVMLLVDNEKIPPSRLADVYIIALINPPEMAQSEALLLAEKLRDALPGLNVLMNCDGGSFKSQFKRADKSTAAFALILGDDERRDQTISVKSLREEASQITLNLDQLIDFLKNNALKK